MHKLAKFSANPGKVHFEVLVRLLIFIRENKTLGLKYYADMNDALVSELLRQVSIKIENQFMDFSDYSWQDCPGTGEVQEHTLSFIKVGQLNMAHMFQYQLLNQVNKVSTIHHALN